MGKQGELLKKFKEDDEFFGHVGLSGSNIYFNIGLHKFLCKIPILKKSALMSNYFKSNLKLITKVYMANVDDLVGKSKKVVKSICFIIFHPCLDNFVWSGEFYSVQRLETFIQCGDFCPVRRLTQCREFLFPNQTAKEGWKVTKLQTFYWRRLKYYRACIKEKNFLHQTHQNKKNHCNQH